MTAAQAIIVLTQVTTAIVTTALLMFPLTSVNGETGKIVRLVPINPQTHIILVQAQQATTAPTKVTQDIVTTEPPM